jgi:aryl-alcohol dehydrogenase-like predicted oxidoreductase
MQLSEIALGTGDNAGGIIYGTSKEQIQLVEKALELGVNTFDCSPDYGKGLGEANLGRVLREIGVPDAQIITKVEIMPEEVSAGMIRDKVRQSLEDSLLRLRREHIDIFMLHNPVRMTRNPGVRVWMRLTPDDVLNEVMPVMEKLRSEGKVRFLGLACEASETCAVLPLLATGAFAAINAWYNLANPTAATSMRGFPPEEDYQGLFEAAEKAGAGVAVIRPLAGGALTDRILSGGSDARHPLSRGYFRDNPHLLEPELDRGRRFRFLAKEGRTLSHEAYRFVLSHPAVSTIVCGISEPAHLEEAARASDAGALDRREMSEIAAVFQQGFFAN